MHSLRTASVSSLLALTAAATPQVPEVVDQSEPEFEFVTAFNEHGTEVTSLAFDEAGEWLSSASSDRVCTWWARDGKGGREFTPRVGRATALRFDAKGHLTMATSEDRPTRVVLRELGEELLPLRFDPNGAEDENSPQRGGFRPKVSALAFTPDGEQLVTASSSWLVGGGHGYPGGALKLWNAETGEFIRQFGEVRESEYRYHEDGVEKVTPKGAELRPGLSTSTGIRSLALSPDGSLVAVGTHGAGGELPESGEIRIWKTSNGEHLRTLTLQRIVPQGGQSTSIKALALNPDGTRVAAALAGRRPGDKTGRDAIIRIWDIETGDQALDLEGHETAITTLTFSPDGTYLAAAGDDRLVRIWDTGTGEPLADLRMPVMRVHALTFSPDGTLLAAGGGDLTERSTVRVWSCPGE